MDLFDLFAKISLDTSEYERRLDNAGKKFEDFSKKLQDIGKKISDAGSSWTKAVSVPLAGFGVATGKFAMDFEDSMAKVSTIADATVLPIEDIEKAIIALSNETGVASGEIAESVYNVISATGDTANAVNLVGDATKLATAGFSDSNSALSILTTAMNAYGLSADQAAHISDSLIMTQNLGVTTVADLSTSMSKAIATASAYGVNLENLESAYVSLTKGGINTAESTTYLSSMFKELGDSGSTVGKIIQEETGQSFGSLMNDGYSLADVLSILYDSTNQNSEAFINLWGSAEAGKASNAIVNQGLQEFNTNLQQITESAGTTESAYEKMQTNSWELGKAFNELKNAVTELGNVLVPVIIPAFISIVEKVTEVVQWFNNLDDGTKQLILTIAGIAAAVGPVLIVVGKIITAIGTITGAISGLVGVVTNGITAILGIGGKLMGGIQALFALIMAHPVIAVITAIIAAVVLLWQNCEQFRDIVKGVLEAVVGFFKEAYEAITGAFSSAVEFFSGVVDGIKGAFDGIGEFLGGLFTAAWEMVKSAWDAAVEFFAGIGEGIRSVFEAVTSFLGEAFSAAWDVVSGAWEAATGFFGDIWDSISGAAQKAGEAVGKALKDAWESVKKAWDGAISFFSGIASEIVGAFTGIGGKFLDIGRSIVDGIKNGISNAWRDFMGWLEGKVGSIVQGVKNMLGIHSPSTVFAGIGENMALGLAEGWDDQYSSIKRQIEGGMRFSPATVGISGLYGGTYGGQSAAQAGRGAAGNTFNFTFNSPKALDPVSAAREARKAAQQMALAYV